MADYNKIDKLKNPVNDAEMMCKQLESKGVKVFKTTNCDQDQYTKTEKEFFRYLSGHPNALALLFYAGHAVEYKNSNKLLLISNAAERTITKDSVCLSKFIARWVLDRSSCFNMLAVHTRRFILCCVSKVTVDRC